jgi:hypothetical protein
MKRIIFSGGFTIMAIMFCLLSCSFTAQAQAQTNHVSDASTSVNVTENDQCFNLEAFLQQEFSKSAKPLKDNPAVRLLGLQKKDAIVKALNLCIKLKTTEKESTDGNLVYELPDGLGSIIIQEVYKDNIFLKVKLVTGCQKLPFVEIWYLSLKRYNNS